MGVGWLIAQVRALTPAPLAACLLASSAFSCRSGPPPLTADRPLHLEEHLDVAHVAATTPGRVPAVFEWRFEGPQSGWTSVAQADPRIGAPQLEQIGNALRVSLTEANRDRSSGRLRGEIRTELSDSKLEDWGYVLVRARSSEAARGLELGVVVRGAADQRGDPRGVVRSGGVAAVIGDGTIRSHILRVEPSRSGVEDEQTQIGLVLAADEPASIELLSVSILQMEADYADTAVGVRSEVRSGVHRRAVHIHTPGRLEYRIRVPDAGRLDIGLGVQRDNAPVIFRIAAERADGESVSLFEEVYSDAENWGQRTVDLSSLAGETVIFALEVEAESTGTVALWGSPTLSGPRTPDKPNVVLYVIDAAAADYMSVYGYDRATTPNLERLAAEGAIFERAYSNSSWTKPSTASFMTSLHHSVLGGYEYNSDPVPDEAATIAELLHVAGYQTGAFVFNPFAGSLSDLQRGVDFLNEGGGAYDRPSVARLHERYWRWREAYPGEPYWVHFQIGDVHPPHNPVPPFAGRFVDAERRRDFYEWQRRLEDAGGRGRFERFFASRSLTYADVFERTGIDRLDYYAVRGGLYDEGMASVDEQIGQLVQRLKEIGEWRHTLFIVAADHGTHSQQRLGQLDPLPPPWGPMFRSSVARIPLIVVWPERIAPGQRFADPVSMIDLLPTTIDLTGVTGPDIRQGQSLAPLLLGQEGWEARPVILDEFNIDRATREFRGVIELIDGRWGASLEINPDPSAPAEIQRPAPLLLYDLVNDPYCLQSVHEEHPDLIEKYGRLLEAKWTEHQALGQRFSRARALPIGAEQLRILRALGYIE